MGENKNNYVNSDNENDYVESDDSDDKNNYIESSENIFENNTLPNFPFDNEFGSYFSSSIFASIFAWITKHMINLVKILNHQNFDIKEVLTNIRYFKKNSRARLSLLTVKKYTIPISNMKTQSTSQPFREAYAISLFDIAN
ncbi:unnamed protein product [Rhizophagus irregularis]|nr:unnamed protein product [Rhizophagus irregularis]